ncbi:MAG TPA: Gfo/Idh/MocA family oxidoreductase [Candidatus Hydrogenedentes bacterium]|nr:Gfo/Idh/MocA family oxidoreductase [Candidatus Hydrogenedentota bacterium]HPG65914.1 Gfo/Idh/MocA family oxidoreductase [Candidatus Hydrogenedentota bacterium]
MESTVSRRDFVKGSAAVAAGVATSLASPRARGANERIRAGYIGVANRGGQLIKASQPHENLEIGAVCDVYKPIMEQRAQELGGVQQYDDFRQMLENKDIDAIFIATPDHWHAIQSIMACEAGKDVYCEKPLSMTIVEGRKMVEAARRTKRIVQVGTHRRSSELLEKLHQLVREDAIGKVSVGHCYRLSNMWPEGIGKLEDSPPPEGLDWDMWLGPRAEQPFRANIAPYKFRWWQNYSSQVGNWGVHYMDMFRWMVDEEAPVSVSAHGGRFAVDDDRTIPDTMEVIFEFASGRLLIFGQYEASGYAMMPGEIDLRGTKGICYASERFFEFIPERDGQFQKADPRMEPMKVTDTTGNHDLTVDHIGNFLECIKSRELPKADVEIGHRSTSFSLLANIALATRSRIDWDPVAERVTNNEKANELLHYEYRTPWTLG